MKAKKSISMVLLSILCAFPFVQQASASELKSIKGDTLKQDTNSMYYAFSRDKMDEYREVYKIINGSEEGFSEISILNASNQSKAIMSNYFNSTGWITRNGVISLSLNPKQEFLNMAYDGSVYAAAVQESWSQAKKKYSSDKRWKNETALRLQYICHTDYARYKTPWNIEPHRTETSYIKVVAAKCNP